MENKVNITVKFNGLDVNGNKKYLYNFYKDGENVNEYFRGIGRKTKNGISSFTYPTDMEKYIKDSFFGFTHLKIGDDLGKAQKRIDKCNSKKGCNYYCDPESRRCCTLLQAHSELIEKLDLIDSFRGCKILEL